MARRVFFSFDYRNVWRVNQIRNVPEIVGTAAAGFRDASIWEEARKKGDAAIKRMIDKALQRTSVTVVCISRGTAARRYIRYEMDESLSRGNGLLGLHIHHLKDDDGETVSAGTTPTQIEDNGFKAYKYTTPEALARWIEDAAARAGR